MNKGNGAVTIPPMPTPKMKRQKPRKPTAPTPSTAEADVAQLMVAMMINKSSRPYMDFLPKADQEVG